MSLVKYSASWVGIDSGREGLWKEPIWTDVLKIISAHPNEKVYDPESPIYKDLEHAYPREAWRSKASSKMFRPLFRDYPNSWTRSNVISLLNKRFNITQLGSDVLAGRISKADVFVNMFKSHKEVIEGTETYENPFSILASAFLDINRPIKTEEVYWAVMKNYRPEVDSLVEILKKKVPLITSKPGSTPYRRLRNMLSLMRSANIIKSTIRDSSVFWTTLDSELLKKISERSN